jgi:hypothetical protein
MEELIVFFVVRILLRDAGQLLLIDILWRTIYNFMYKMVHFKQ